MNYARHIISTYPEARWTKKTKAILRHYFSPHEIRLNIIQTLIGKDLGVIANCSKISGDCKKSLVYVHPKKELLAIGNTFIAYKTETPDYLIEI